MKPTISEAVIDTFLPISVQDLVCYNKKEKVLGITFYYLQALIIFLPFTNNNSFNSFSSLDLHITGIFDSVGDVVEPYLKALVFDNVLCRILKCVQQMEPSHINVPHIKCLQHTFVTINIKN